MSQEDSTTNNGPLVKPTKFFVVTLILAVIGIGLSFYALDHHFQANATDGGTGAACNINSQINCDDVARSDYAEIFGIPLAMWGVSFFLMLLVMAGLGLKAKEEKGWLESFLTIYILTASGVLVSIILAGISFFDLNVLCPTCAGVYVLNTLLLGNWWLAKESMPEFDVSAALNGLGTSVITGAIAILLYSQFLAKPEIPGGEPRPDAPVLASTKNDIKIHKSQYSGLGEDYRKGNDRAKVSIVEFADFECGACGAMSNTLARINKRFGDDVQIVFRNYPLDKGCNDGMQFEMHPNACYVAMMARCAGRFGRFWPYHDLAFAQQRSASTKAAEEWAKQVGLTDQQIKDCKADTSIMDKIRDDVKVGNDLGVSATPTLFVNGRKFLGRSDYNSLAIQIEKMLAE